MLFPLGGGWPNGAVLPAMTVACESTLWIPFANASAKARYLAGETNLPSFSCGVKNQGRFGSFQTS
jgi:hypothetical protein